MKKTKLTKTEKKLIKDLENVTEKLQDTILMYTNTAYQKRQLEAQVKKLQEEKEILNREYNKKNNEINSIVNAIISISPNTPTIDIKSFIGFICGQNSVYRDIVNGKRVETQTIAGTVTK